MRIVVAARLELVQDVFEIAPAHREDLEAQPVFPHLIPIFLDPLPQILDLLRDGAGGATGVTLCLSEKLAQLVLRQHLVEIIGCNRERNLAAERQFGAGCNGRIAAILQDCGFPVERLDQVEALVERLEEDDPLLLERPEALQLRDGPAKFGFSSGLSGRGRGGTGSRWPAG